MRALPLFLACAVLGASPVLLPAQELVTDGGFEQLNGGGGRPNHPILDGGPVSPFVFWGATGNYTSIGTESSLPPPHSGNYDAAFGQVGAPGSLFQILNTNPGQIYVLSFFLGRNGGGSELTNFVEGGAVQTFQAQWNGATVFAANNSGFSGTDPYVPYSINVLATGVTTRLEFIGQNDPGFYFLDDVSVMPLAVPEPATWAAGALTLGLAGVAWRRRRA